LSKTFSFRFDVVAWGDGDPAVDFTEAFVKWRQLPRSAWRSQVKVGAFYAPISLENRLAGWRSPFALSSSAINTWVGEELRTIGVEYELDWLGQQVGRSFELGGVVGVYAWNDPAGVIMAERGWGIHDRQTTLFGQLGQRELFHEIDGRPGYYVGLNGRFSDRVELRALHYDNLGDRVSYSAAIDDYAWETVFDSLGVAWTPARDWTVLVQALRGETLADPFIVLDWDFESAFILASWARGDHRVSARFDTFEMQQVTGNPATRNADSGEGYMLSYHRQLGQRFSAIVEALLVDGRLAARAEIGEPVAARESQAQLAIRFQL
jgi:hypothetical protein